MFYFVCALYAEAKPLISALSLRKDAFSCPYDTYFSEDSSVVLAISGMGPIAGAAASSYLLTRFGFRSEKDFLINFGSCAGKDPGLYLINKITDNASGRTFYPDMLYDLSDCGLPSSSEKALVTVPRVVSSLEDSESLYEMEASGIFQAASHVLPPHRMLFLKYVSDAGVENAKAVTAEYLSSCSEKYLPAVLSVLKKLEEACEEKPSIDEELLLSTSYALHLSETLRFELRQLFMYANASGKNMEKILNDLDADGKLDVSSKREGKVVLDAIRQKLI